MIRAAAFLLLCLSIATSAAQALDLSLPSNTRETASQISPLDGYFAPTGVYSEGQLPGMRIEGEVRRSAFRITTPGLTPLQLLQPLRTQLEEAGYSIILDCPAVQCGGFDFRFATETIPAPAMHISLRNFHFLTGVMGTPDAPESVVTMLASTSSAAAHLQIIQAGDLGDAPNQFTRNASLPVAGASSVRPTLRPIAPSATPETPDETPEAPAIVVPETLPDERFALVGVSFGAGSDTLDPGPIASLENLARILTENPDYRVALVGHTDNTGALEVNISISRKRAEAVRQRLISAHGIAATRVTSHGVGYLAPIASNTTEEGRLSNRRVEAVILP